MIKWKPNKGYTRFPKKIYPLADDAYVLQQVLVSNTFYLQTCAGTAPCQARYDKWVCVFHGQLGSATDTAFPPSICRQHQRAAGFPVSPAPEVAAQGPFITCSACPELNGPYSFQGCIGSTGIVARKWLNFFKKSQLSPHTLHTQQFQ